MAIYCKEIDTSHILLGISPLILLVFIFILFGIIFLFKNRIPNSIKDIIFGMEIEKIRKSNCKQKIYNIFERGKNDYYALNPLTRRKALLEILLDKYISIYLNRCNYG